LPHVNRPSQGGTFVLGTTSMTTRSDLPDPLGSLEFADLAEPDRRYAIRDARGVLRATLVRTADKTMWWEGPNGRPGLGGVSVCELPLYGSDRLEQVPLEVPVVLTEGPKDCEAVWRAKLPAVATVTGAATIPSGEVLEVLRDRIVILCPDNDEPGYRHMKGVAQALTGVAREIRWLQIPGLGPKAGAADVPTAELARLVATYARVIDACVSTDSTSWREKGVSPYSSRESLEATYAREVGTKRYSRAELAELRKGVQVRFDAPSDAALRELINTLERIQGRLVRPNLIDYLIRCYKIQGPYSARLLSELYRERATTENLLLALELAPPSYSAGEPGPVSHSSIAEVTGPVRHPEADQVVESWRCWADLGSGHVPALRADGSVYCGTCHPGAPRR
jgi:hypothetical protein